MKDVCFMCGEPATLTMELWGRKERMCVKCCSIIISSLDKEAGTLVPAMIKVRGKLKSIRTSSGILELTDEQSADFERLGYFIAEP